MKRKINVVNPSKKSFYDGSYRRIHSTREAGAFVFTFGAYGSTHLLVYADSLESGLETAAGWLADNAPGLITPHGDPELLTLIKEVADERGIALPGPGQEWTEEYWDCEQEAFADMTYTEAGYINSWEWTVIGPLTPKEIAVFAKGE